MSRLKWWAPVAFVAGLMVVSAVGAWLIDGPISPRKFGNAAEWATAYGTVLAVTLALHRREEISGRRETAEAVAAEEAARSRSNKEVAESLTAIEKRAERCQVVPKRVEKAVLLACVLEANSELATCEEPAVLAHKERLAALATQVSDVQDRPTTDAEFQEASRFRTELCDTLRATALTLDP